MGGLDWLMWSAIFGGLVFLSHASIMAFENRRKVKVRMEGPTAPAAMSVLKGEESAGGRLKRLLSWLSPYGKLAQQQGEEGKYRSLLINAGFRQPNALTIFYGIKALVALLLPLPVMFLLIMREKLTLPGIFLCFLVGALGYYLPILVLRRCVRKRQDVLDRALPDVIDLFIICMEAGLALPATINRVADEIKQVSEAFHHELQIVAGEMRTGFPRETALKNLERRTGVQSIQSLVTLMIQSERLGTSLAQSLRAHADFSRSQRTLKAEEMAAKLPVKIVIPMVCFILPAMFVVIVGPGIISMGKTLIPLLMGMGKH